MPEASPQNRKKRENAKKALCSPYFSAMKEAYRLFREAAEGGDVEAMNSLGALTFIRSVEEEYQEYGLKGEFPADKTYLIIDQRLGEMTLTVPKPLLITPKEAKAYFLKGKADADPYASYNYYVCLTMGLGGNAHPDIAIQGFEYILEQMLGVPNEIRILAHFWLSYLYDKKGGGDALVIRVEKKFLRKPKYRLAKSLSRSYLHLIQFLDMCHEEDNYFLLNTCYPIYRLYHLCAPLEGRKAPFAFHFRECFMKEVPGFLLELPRDFYRY